MVALHWFSMIRSRYVQVIVNLVACLPLSIVLSCLVLCYVYEQAIIFFCSILLASSSVLYSKFNPKQLASEKQLKIQQLKWLLLVFFESFAKLRQVCNLCISQHNIYIYTHTLNTQYKLHRRQIVQCNAIQFNATNNNIHKTTSHRQFSVFWLKKTYTK